MLAKFLWSMSLKASEYLPVQSNESPSQRSSNGRDMDSTSIGVVAEVEGRQVEEIDDQDNLRPEEVSPNKQHYPGELQEIVEDEVASDTGRSLDVVAILGEEVPDVCELGDEESEPGILAKGFS